MKSSWVLRAPYDEAEGGQAAELAGQTLAGRYRVERAIGRGPLGTVYRAEDTEHRKRVAIKVFDAEIEPDGDEARRLLADLETASGLMNPHLVPPLDAGVTGGRLFVVEPLLAGQSLAERLEQEGPQAPLDAVRYALEVLVALDALHRHHILHLDLKPQNLFVVRDPLGMERVLVGGVGQQHALGLDAAPARSEGQSRATAAYLAPEIVSGKPRDMRTDLYQLGLVLYEVLTGRPPFDGDPPDVLARRHVLERPPSPRFVRGDDQIPDALDLIVVRCLEKVARKRFSSAGEMTSALEQVAQKGAATAGGVRFRAAALAAGTRPPVDADPPPFADFADEPPPEGPITRLDVRKLLEPAPRIDAPPQLSETPKVTAEDIAALRRPRRTPPIGSAVPPADDAAPTADAAAMTLVEGGRTLVDPIYRPPPRPVSAAPLDDGEDDTGAFDGSAFPGAALDAIEENPRRIDTPAARAPTMPVELAGQTHADVRPAGVPVAAPESRRSGPLDAWQKRISAPPAAAPVEAATRPDDPNDRTDEHLPLEDEDSAQRTVETPSIAAALAAGAGADAAETGPDRMGAAPAAADDGWSVGEDPEDTLDGIDPRRPKPVLPFVIAAVALAAVALVFVLIPKSTPEAPAPEEEATRVTIGGAPPVAPAPAPDAAVPDAAPDAAPPPTPDELHAAATEAFDARRWAGADDALAERLAALRAAAPTDTRINRLAERGAREALRDSQQALRADDLVVARAAAEAARALVPGDAEAGRQLTRIERRAEALAKAQAAAEKAAADKAAREAAKLAAAEKAAAEKAEREAAKVAAAEQRAAEKAAAAERAAAEKAAAAERAAAAKLAAAEKAAAEKAERDAAKLAAAEKAAAEKAERDTRAAAAPTAAVPVAATAAALTGPAAPADPDAAARRREARAREEADAARRQQSEAEAAARREAAEQAAAEQRKSEREQRRAEVKAALDQGREQVKAAQWDAARASFQDALAKEPGNAAAHAGLGDVAFQQQRFADAVTHHRAAVEAAPKNAGYHVNLGMAYYRLQNFEQAQVWWQKALDLQPANAQAQRYLDLVKKKLE